MKLSEKKNFKVLRDLNFKGIESYLERKQNFLTHHCNFCAKTKNHLSVGHVDKLLYYKLRKWVCCS